MSKGFTLLELMVVLVILVVLATLGLQQYQAAIRKSRNAEAEQVLSQLRSQCAAVYMADKDTSGCSEANLRIGTERDMVPGSCRQTHYFYYSVSNAGGDDITFTATRCTVGGKEPQGKSDSAIELKIDFSTGQDTWAGVLYPES